MTNTVVSLIIVDGSINAQFPLENTKGPFLFKTKKQAENSLKKYVLGRIYLNNLNEYVSLYVPDAVLDDEDEMLNIAGQLFDMNVKSLIDIYNHILETKGESFSFRYGVSPDVSFLEQALRSSSFFVVDDSDNCRCLKVELNSSSSLGGFFIFMVGKASSTEEDLEVTYEDALSAAWSEGDRCWIVGDKKLKINFR